MKVLTTTCPNCGATMELNEKTEKAVCDYCSTKIISKDDKEQAKKKTAAAIEEFEIDFIPELFKTAESFLALEDYFAATNIYNEILLDAPDDLEAYKGYLIAKTKNMNLSPTERAIFPYEEFETFK
ncbi:hypothetical protein [Marinicrinis lubricantis]|uniref:Uncharacterized protein n=1 Tax=Marinicrinis lubricantis TaxID=2086470 RepID=A0ABW1IQY9_9BACL